MYLKFMQVAVVAVALGCTTVIGYEPAVTMGVDEARATIDELIMTQHHAWRPSHIEFTDGYFLWGSGSISKTHGSRPTNFQGFVLGNNTTTRTKSYGERFYFDSVRPPRLSTWQRKFRTWYVVLLSDPEHGAQKYVYRTRDLDRAKNLVDAFAVLIANCPGPRCESGGGMERDQDSLLTR